MNFRIKNLEDNSELRQLTEHLLKQPQSYPDYESWVFEKLIPRIESGEYIPHLFFSDGQLYGDSIYRFLDHKKIAEQFTKKDRFILGLDDLDHPLVEIKNFRIDPNYHHQYWGAVLLTQLFLAAKDNTTVTDVNIDNKPALDFFTRHGFKVLKTDELYRHGQKEIIIYHKHKSLRV